MQGEHALVPAATQVKKGLTEVSNQLLDKMHKNAINIYGQFDDAGAVLDALEIERVNYHVTQIDTQYLTPDKMVIINCPGYGFSDRGIKKLGYFVRDGGWLFTTDWSLGGVIERGFPRSLATDRSLPDTVVTVQPERHPLTKGVHGGAEFWIEGGSHTFDIIDPNIKVIIRSDEMARLYGNPNILVGWQCGKGKVFHCLSHLVLQRSKQGETRVEDAAAMIQILTNILVQKGYRNTKKY